MLKGEKNEFFTDSLFVVHCFSFAILISKEFHAYVRYMTQVPYMFSQLDAEIFSQVYAEIVLGFCRKLSRFLRKLPQNTYRGAGQLLYCCAQ